MTANREIKFRAWLTLSDYDDNGNDKDYTAVTKNISVSSSGYIGFSLDEGSSIFGGDIFERALENGNAYEYEEWCTWDGGFELMQYTGIKDKNGVDIYEGDIIEWFRIKPENGEFYPDRTKRKAVVWEEYNRCVGYNLRPTQNEQESYWEVIGNIYENPELLSLKEKQ